MTSKKRYNRTKTRTRKIKGGKMISSDKNVQLNYQKKMINCEVCGKNNYKETTGTFGKSKIRSGVGDLLFGDSANILDTTSVIIYTCNNCGLCRIIRNKEPLQINITELQN